jgi:hypothetical protein
MLFLDAAITFHFYLLAYSHKTKAITGSTKKVVGIIILMIGF